jgi:hypothetical protein
MKGILFRPDMIKAIGEGRKTVTRRLLNPQPFMERGVLRWQPKRTNGFKGMHKPDINMDDHSDLAPMFANYQVGEVVYIKEACQVCNNRDGSLDKSSQPIYKSDLSEADLKCDVCDWDWLSPLFMPEWAARYFINITDVRAARLQEITEEDAIAEGITKSSWEFNIAPYRSYIHKGVNAGRSLAVAAYMDLWNSINKPPYDWQSNPWVWRYEFSFTPRG